MIQVKTNLSGIKAYRDSNYGYLASINRAPVGEKKVIKLMEIEEKKPQFPWLILGIAFLLLRKK